MKYIKAYEKINELPKIGEYFKIDDTALKVLHASFNDFDNNGYIKVIEIDPKHHNKYISLTSKNNKLNFHEDLFDRKLTDDEITQFELELMSNKFNI